MVSPPVIPVDLTKLNNDPDHYLVTRLGLAYNDIANVAELNVLVSQAALGAPHLLEIHKSMKIYLEIQNAIHLAGAIEIMPEISLRAQEEGVLSKAIKSIDRLTQLLAQLEEYFVGDKKIGVRAGVKGSVFRTQIVNLRDNLGAHYNSSPGGTVLARALQDFVLNTDGQSQMISGVKDICAPRYIFAEDILVTAWSSFCMKISAQDSSTATAEKVEAGVKLFTLVKDTFCEFACLLIFRYLKLLDALPEGTNIHELSRTR